MTAHPEAAPLVLLSVAGGVATVTLNRPARLNALLPQTFAELRAHLAALTSRSDVTCLVLTGSGRSFCAGLDLDAIDPDAEPAGHEAAETIDLLESFPFPTIAKITGHCLTGGLELALACDLLVCADDASFGDTHGRWGLVPAWGLSVRLPERVGRSRARELSFTGRIVAGSAAAAIGLADRSVPPGQLDDAVAELAGEIASGSRDSNRIYKSLYAERGSAERTRALAFERSLPYGLPADMRARLAPRTREPPTGS
ncbi:enoyl-CoA hydratase/isomerase family protein [Nocardioides houyundeii]|uniref:enoyl-CoA hydratase/isomerase family protein n=1 Tax=Nocardioides houyundeii TaxID=2045452 RepID=UPI000C7769A9|nr:enoyl-CoA hydratase/isomerase family protein [Nocardioides houyundeii]